MLKQLTTLVLALALCAGSMATTGCTPTASDVLVIAVEGQPKSLDPRLGSGDGVSARLHQIVFDSLVRKNERFEFVPHLAESFSQSLDAKTFTFTLRKGVKFHNGQELTSADVKYTYESILDPNLKSPVAASFARIEAIDTPDPLTAVIRCREPYPQLLGDLVAIPVIASGTGATPGSTPLGTGPFKVVDMSEQVVELEAHAEYFLGAPAVKKLRIRVVPDNNTRELELQSGGVDLAINSGFQPDTVAKMQSDPSLQIVIAPGTNIAHLGLNTTDDALKNAKVRQALALALNREQIITTILQGQARAADAIMPPESWAYEDAIARYPFDVAKAKALLDEAGFKDPDGDGPAVRFTVEFLTANVGLAPSVAQIVQEQWKAVGVGVNATSFERATFFERLNQGNFDAYFITSVGANQTPDVFGWAYYPTYWGADRSDLDAAAGKVRGAADADAAAADMQAMLAIVERKQFCPSVDVDRLIAEAKAAPDAATRRAKLLSVYDLLTSRGGGNRMRYCNPMLADLILKAERASNRDEKRALFGQIQKAVADDVPQIYLWYQANVVVARKRVGSIAIDPSGSWYFLQKVTLAAS